MQRSGYVIGLLCLIAVFSVFVGSVEAKYSGGSGIESDPYKIATAEDLMVLAADSNDYDKCFVLTADIDLSGYNFTKAVIAPDLPDISPSFDGVHFTGIFDGNGYKILNLNINTLGEGNDYLGLFGCIKRPSRIMNIGVEGCSISGGNDSDMIGAICGKLELLGNSHILNSFSSGKIISGENSDYVGGICGLNIGKITNSYSSTDIICGIGSREFGGLCGSNYGVIEECFSTGVSRANNWYTGLSGYTKNEIYSSFWDIQIARTWSSAGGTGLRTHDMTNIDTYIECGWDFVEELTNGDENIWQISQGDYPSLSWQEISKNPVPNLEAITIEQAQDILAQSGYHSGSVQYTYSDTIPIGYVASSFPKSGVFAAKGRVVYPFVSLGPSPYSGGIGNFEDPLKIGSASDLFTLANTPNDIDKYFVLISDIDLDPNVTGMPAFTTALISRDYIPGEPFAPFTGVFDGNNHEIRNLTINTIGTNNHRLGLFGIIKPTGVVQNLYLEDVSVITGEDSDYIGGMCGENNGSLINCHVNTYLSSGKYSSNKGGLCGINYGTIAACDSQVFFCGEGVGFGGLCAFNEGIIKQSFSSGEINVGKASGDVGGLCSVNRGEISNCYTSTNVIVSSGGYVGGFCGENIKDIINCYSTGYVSQDGGFCGKSYGGLIADCFWDMQTSGQTTSDKGYGLTTEKMLDQQSFIDKGWDFAGESVNGEEEIWQISKGDYPILSWQRISGKPIPDLNGLDVEQAKTVLAGKGYQAGGVGQGYSDTVPAGFIVSTIPEAGVYAAEGRQVYMIISIGPSPYSGSGTGTKDDPIEIANSSDVLLLAASPNDFDKNFILAADIDLDPNVTGEPVFSRALIAYDTLTWKEGFQGEPFIGVFDGNDHKISNITIRTKETSLPYLGLFGKIGPCGSVKKLILNNFTLIATESCGAVGGICGNNFYGSIADCNATVLIKIDVGGCIGGICGVNNEGDIVNCVAKGRIVGSRMASKMAGLCGISSGFINNCWASTYVEGGGEIAGLVGNSSGSISNCFATGDIKGLSMSSEIGGICGLNSGEIFKSYSLGNIFSHYNTRYIGGFCGSNSSGVITDCYARGNLVGGGHSYIGGFCGENYYGTILNSYSKGKVTDGYSDVGGFCGWNTGSITKCFWDKQTSGRTESDGGTGRTTIQMQTLSTYTKAKWDFKRVWYIDEGFDYPRHKWEINRGPVAVAGEDFEVCAELDGYVVVELDGSGSSDPDGDELDYLWFWEVDGETYMAEGEAAAVELPIGEHSIGLLVDDGILESEADYVTVSVWPTYEFSMHLTPRRLCAGSKGRWVKAHFTLPAGYSVEDIDVESGLVMEPFGLSSDYMNVFVNEGGFVEIEAGFDRSGFGSLGEYRNEEAKVWGKLTGGECFYGLGTIRVFDRRLEQLGVMSMHWLEQGCERGCEQSDLDGDGMVNFADYALMNDFFVDIYTR